MVEQSKQLRNFLRMKQLRQVTGISRSQIYLLEANGRFPRRIPLGPRSVAWDAGEVAQWQADRLEHRKEA